MQAVAAIKLLTGNEAAVAEEMLTFDLWASRIRAVSLIGAKSPDCPTCGGRRDFEFLNRRTAGRSTSLCGRNAVQVRPPAGTSSLDLNSIALRLAGSGEVERTPYLLRCRPGDAGGVQLTLFPDGRLIVSGTTNPDQARSLYARYVGA
jgi:adenylyltransferase/sulfurtransferase